MLFLYFHYFLEVKLYCSNSFDKIFYSERTFLSNNLVLNVQIIFIKFI